MNKAEITVKGPMGRISLDGHEVSTAVRSLKLTAGAGEMPTLMLELLPGAVHVNASDGKLLLEPGVVEILEAAGWTAPGKCAAHEACR